MKSIKASDIKIGDIFEGSEVVEVEMYECDTKVCVTTTYYDDECGEFDFFPMEIPADEVVEVE